ncbi:hypothetical protein E2542_SST00665 [Spatholobus suberectus]|nr:hypothetical protein E2542_SST00665 [Spatholobus suberectus]
MQSPRSTRGFFQPNSATRPGIPTMEQSRKANRSWRMDLGKWREHERERLKVIDREERAMGKDYKIKSQRLAHFR